jgi:hypothetical protein
VWVPDLQGADRGPWTHLRRGYEPAGEANFSVPRSVIVSFYSAVDDGSWEVPKLEVRECPPSTLRNIDGAPPGDVGVGSSEVGDVDGGPLGVVAAGLAAATTEVEDIDDGSPVGCWWQIRHQPHLKLKTSMTDPLGGAGGKVQQRPPPKLKTSMTAPLGVLAGRSGSGHHRS